MSSPLIPHHIPKPYIDGGAENYVGPLRASSTLPKTMVVNFNAVRDNRQLPFAMFHNQIFWADDEHPGEGIKRSDGYVFLYQSAPRKLFFKSDWDTRKAYVAVTLPKDPLAQGLPIINAYFREEDAVTLLCGTQGYGRLYHDRASSTHNPTWSNRDYVTQWYDKSYQEMGDVGYLPDPEAPRGCVKTNCLNPPTISTGLRNTNYPGVSAIAKTSRDWYAIGINCAPCDSLIKFNAANDLHKASCGCYIDMLDNTFTTTFEMVTDTATMEHVMNGLM